MRLLLTGLFLVTFFPLVLGQESQSSRATMYFTMGRTGTNLREFNQMLENKGLSPMRKGYTNFNFGYQARYNDFILGVELFHNPGPKSLFNGYEIDYRTTRFNVNVGFSFTEEGPFQLIHYMSVGSGFLNFQMLRENEFRDLDDFLQSPAQGFILRDGNIHKNSLNLSGFLTEIGFQLSYDLPIPGRDEALALMAKFGYSFSPFENSWNVNGISFNSTQSGAFLRLGAGITLPDYKYFYKDASLGVHIFYGLNFTSPDFFNEHLVDNGLQPFTGRPNNWGLKVLGYSKQLMYGMDFFNLGLGGKASETQSHSLNSVRVYANGGLKLLDLRNLEIGALAGIGFGNLRYTLTSDIKPDFPRLFEEPDHDGYLAAYGAMLKPEAFITYGIPLSQKKFMDLILGIHAGYELPASQYKLADLAMFKYMANPYLQFSVGIRP
ncbi:hypothetical protein [Cecembia calidifontis]|uniref:Uncharacterized protein n=1 Tax=Cecembia calidifontis TaxID=1187080 RepID=A0A4Q7P9L3_9BACT|nr:hypothetical protein [Cecembia calidifontis]RZS96913.1 hypothetical protein BC751_2508 [Cecembia calidifontis]